MKIGELAEKANVTKRTVDYYTNLGLLEAERSSSNYRYYNSSSVEKLKFIVDCKNEGMSLEKIKKKLLEKDTEKIDLLELRLRIKGLEEDVSKVLAKIDRSDLQNQAYVKKHVSHESLSLIQSLLLLLS